MPPRRKVTGKTVPDEEENLSETNSNVVRLTRRSVARKDSPRPNLSQSMKKKKISSNSKSLAKVAEKSPLSIKTKSLVNSPENYTKKTPVRRSARKVFVETSNLRDDNHINESDMSISPVEPASFRSKSIFSSSAESEYDSAEDFVNAKSTPKKYSTGRLSILSNAKDLSPIRPCPDLFEDPLDLSPSSFLMENLRTYGDCTLSRKSKLKVNKDVVPKKRARTGPSNARLMNSWAAQMNAEFSDVEMHELCIESE